MTNTPFVVSCSKKYEWCLRPFQYLFEKYCNQKIELAFSIAPKEQWVDDFLKFLYQYEPSHFVFILEDFWLNRKVDVEGIDILCEFMKSRPDVLRIDLTTDRLYAGGMVDVCTCDRFDIIEAPKSPYQMSLQTGIWNKALLIEVLEKLPTSNHSIWDVELGGTSIVNESTMRVFGTRQNLVRYVNGMNNARQNEINYQGFSEEDKSIVQSLIKL